MNNIIFETKKTTYLILEIDNNQQLINDLSPSIKTEGKLEEILLKTYFHDLKYSYIGKLSKDFNFNIIDDFEINSEQKFIDFLSSKKIQLKESNNYYLFKAVQTTP